MRRIETRAVMLTPADLPALHARAAAGDLPSGKITVTVITN